MSAPGPRRFWRTLLENRKARLGLALTVLFALVAWVGPWFVQDATAFVARPLEAPSAAHWLGTTGQGQDVLAQTVVGARITLLIGFATGFLVVFIGEAIREAFDPKVFARLR